MGAFSGYVSITIFPLEVFMRNWTFFSAKIIVLTKDNKKIIKSYNKKKKKKKQGYFNSITTPTI